ncbi:hypothetical protein PoB_002853100 [Plakobranchus ocellatus]|uniref:Uncharacterized protein n=1 Tax=Plakobranchus ocellatus TaxID=259542 RepID=A0AAV4A5V9_9GAST|nr:hypothetical protein PoB_002853100 [Plakobranchus ocellatus]
MPGQGGLSEGDRLEMIIRRCLVLVRHLPDQGWPPRNTRAGRKQSMNDQANANSEQTDARINPNQAEIFVKCEKKKERNENLKEKLVRLHFNASI